MPKFILKSKRRK